MSKQNNQQNLNNQRDNENNQENSQSTTPQRKMDDLKSGLKNVANNFKIKELENENKKMADKLKELEDKNLRLHADIDNIHKQNSIDLPRYKKMGKESVLSPVINFLSTLHIAFTYAPKSEDEAVVKYVETLKGSFEKLKKELLDLNIEIVEPRVGDKFDPNVMRSLNGADNNEASVMNIVSLGLKVDGVLSYPATVMIQ